MESLQIIQAMKWHCCFVTCMVLVSSNSSSEQHLIPLLAWNSHILKKHGVSKNNLSNKMACLHCYLHRCIRLQMLHFDGRIFFLETQSLCVVRNQPFWSKIWYLELSKWWMCACSYDSDKYLDFYSYTRSKIVSCISKLCNMTVTNMWHFLRI